MSAQNSLISVIIVNYNGGDYLLDTVGSALASSVPIEIFVVDNASADDSIANLRRSYAREDRLNIIENTRNLGFAKANNIAIEQAKGEHLLLLNPDCFVKPDTLQRVRDTMQQDPTVGMAGCLIRNPDGSEQAGCRRSIPTPWSGLLRALHLSPTLNRRQGHKQVDLVHSPLPEKQVYIEAISGAFMMVSRQALQQVGLMDDDYFLHCEDLDWCQAFHEAGWNILFIPGIEIVHHKGACSVDRPLFVLWHKHKGMSRFYRKFLSRSYPLPLNWLVVLGIWLRFAMMLPISLINKLRRFAVNKPARPPERLGQTPQVEPLALIPALRDSQCLITGATGFIGRHLVAELQREGARVRLLSRQPEATLGEALQWVHGDIRDAETLQGICQDVDYVFHLAGCAHRLDQPEASHNLHHEITVRGTRNLLREALGAGVKRFVFVSSVKTMGEISEQFASEDSTNSPESAYGMAKLQAEQELKAAQQQGLQTAVLRLPLVYGPGNKGNLPRLVEAIDKGRFPPPPKVANRRSMVHVDDVIQALLLCASKPQASGRTYLVTDGHAYSTWGIYRDIALYLGKPLPRWRVPMPLIRLGAGLGDLLNSLRLPISLNSITMRKLFGSAWYDDSRIRKELGYKSRYNLRYALPQIIQDQTHAATAGPTAAQTMTKADLG